MAWALDTQPCWTLCAFFTPCFCYQIVGAIVALEIEAGGDGIEKANAVLDTAVAYWTSTEGVKPTFCVLCIFMGFLIRSFPVYWTQVPYVTFNGNTCP